jgi:hypothetical protein
MEQCLIAADYATLELDPGAPYAMYAKVRVAYKRLALKNHPDKNNGLDELFKKINSAYTTILNHLQNDSSTSCALCMNNDTDDETHQVFELVTKIKECSQCLVLTVNSDNVGQWIDSCTKLYGTPRSLNEHGTKFSCVYVYDAESEPHDEPSERNVADKIFVTIFEKGTILIQGNAYLMWHVEHMSFILANILEKSDFPPHVLRSVTKLNPEDSEPESKRRRGKKKKKSSVDPKMSSVCSSCVTCNNEDDDEMLQCSSCDGWIHYNCTRLPPKELANATQSESCMYICPFCELADEVLVESQSQYQDEKLSPSSSAPPSPSKSASEEKSDNAAPDVSTKDNDRQESVKSDQPKDITSPASQNVEAGTATHSECANLIRELSFRIDNIEKQLVKTLIKMP